MNNLYPIFLKTQQFNTLIVGGGNVGLEKLTFLLKSSPKSEVRLVANRILPELHDLAEKHASVTIINRKFEINDLKDIQVAILATENRVTNLEIRAEAKKKNILVNVADTPDLCDFYLGSIVTKGDLKIAISTNGKSPTFAKRFRQLLEEALPEELPELLDQLQSFRNTLKDDFEEKVRKLNEHTKELLLKKK